MGGRPAGKNKGKGKRLKGLNPAGMSPLEYSKSKGKGKDGKQGDMSDSPGGVSPGETSDALDNVNDEHAGKSPLQLAAEGHSPSQV